MTDKNSISNVQRTGILITLLTAQFITTMSTSVTGNMIPNFMEYFGVTSNLAQWVTSGATLISGIAISITAFLIKRMSNKLYFLTAMAAFTVGSLGAFLSPSFSVLLVSRLFQAVGCGMLMPLAQIILLKLYPKEKHGTIMAAYSMSSMLSTVVGPTYAGLMMDAFGWQGVFASLFVLGILIILGGIIFMKNIIDKEEAELNIPYITISSLGFASFLIGISNISSGLFLLKSGGLILLGILLLTVFSVLQLKSEAPMLNLRLFKYRSFRIAVIMSLFLYLIAMGNGMILPIFSKTIRGFSDTSYGLATIVGSALSVVTTFTAGKLYDKVGKKPMFIAGPLFYAVFSLMGMLFSDNTPIVYIAIVFAIQTNSMAMLNSPVTTMALSGLEGKERVDGSAIFNTLRQISSSFASTLSVLLYTLMGSNMTAIHGVYGYYGLVTIAIAVVAFLQLRFERKMK